MGKWSLHASSFIFDRIIIKVAGNKDRHKWSDEFDFGPLVSMAHLYVFWNEIWPWHIGLRWAIIALWATCFRVGPKKVGSVGFLERAIFFFCLSGLLCLFFFFTGSFELALVRACRAYNAETDSVMFGDSCLPLSALQALSKSNVVKIWKFILWSD